MLRKRVCILIVTSCGISKITDYSMNPFPAKNVVQMLQVPALNKGLEDLLGSYRTTTFLVCVRARARVCVCVCVCVCCLLYTSPSPRDA